MVGSGVLWMDCLKGEPRQARPAFLATQWVKNVLAAGSCSIETRGRVVELVEPELVTDPELRPAPPHVRFVEGRIAGATQYLRMRAASST